MVSPIGNAGAPGAAQTLLSTTTSSVTGSSFLQQLESVLEQYLGQSGKGSGVEIDIQPTGSQNPGASQFLVTVTAGNPASTGSTPQPSGAASTPPGAPASGAAAPGGADASSSDPVQVNIGGGGTAMVPTLAWEIANQDQHMSNPLMTPDAIMNEDQGELLDGRAQQLVPGTNLKWDDLTQDQQLAYSYGVDYGFPSGMTVQQFLDAYVGPSIMANAPANNPTLFGNS